jgi:hypothetical protein
LLKSDKVRSLILSDGQKSDIFGKDLFLSASTLWTNEIQPYASMVIGFILITS